MMFFSSRKIKMVMLALGLMVCSAQAEEATVKGIDWRYSVVNGAARIDHLNQICTGKLDIPAKIGTYRVAEVGDGGSSAFMRRLEDSVKDAERERKRRK